MRRRTSGSVPRPRRLARPRAPASGPNRRPVPGRRPSALADALRGALAHIAEHVAGDPPHLDLLGALGDPIPAVVPVDVLERLMPGVAEPAVHLHGPVGGLAA